MKNKKEDFRLVKRRSLSRILRNLLIYTLFMLLLMAGYYLFYRGSISIWVQEQLGSQTMQLLRGKKELLFSIVYLAGALIICVRTARRNLRYLELVIHSLTALVDEGAAIEAFPADLKEVEMALVRLREQLQKREQEAREAEQQKNDLLAYLAHDLKTPLTSVIGYLSLLQENPALPAEQRAKYIDISVEKAYRLEQLINEFFDITRFNTQGMVLEKNRVDLTMMLYQIADEFFPVLAEKGMTAVMDIEAGLKLDADSDKLARVFDNLLRNAVGYGYENTCLCIEAARELGGIRVSVPNQGDPIPPEKLSMIFEKFYRADSSRGTKNGGAGLGLAIAKEIVELHGGTIQVTSEGHEITFLIHLPAHEPREDEIYDPESETLKKRSARRRRAK